MMDRDDLQAIYKNIRTELGPGIELVAEPREMRFDQAGALE